MDKSDKRRAHYRARRLAELRQAACVVRSEGVTLTLHRDGAVTVQREKENHSPSPAGLQSSADKTITHDNCKSLHAAAASEARTELSKKQRDEQRSRERLRDHKEAQACGARWLPIVQCLLCGSRVKFRSAVVAEHKRHKLALREEARALTADLKIHRLFSVYWRRYSESVAGRAIIRSDAHRNFRSLSLFYKRTRDVEAAQAMNSSPTSSCRELSPPGRRLTSARDADEHTPPDDRGAKRAENRQQKSRGGRSRRL